jgi:hypothetical protein
MFSSVIRARLELADGQNYLRCDRVNRRNSQRVVPVSPTRLLYSSAPLYMS